MRKLLIIIVIILVVLTLLPLGALSYVMFTKPNVGPAPALTITSTPAMSERGAYLFNYQAACVACHTPWDTTHFSFPMVKGKEGSGGSKFGRESGVPGVIYAANVTPARLKEWSDGEIYRALTAGVNKQGEALFPLMPYKHYAKLSEPDLHAIIAYMRTLPAIDNEIPNRMLSFPMNIIVRLIPASTTPPSVTPAVTDTAYGAYVTNAAACLHCLTRSNHGYVKDGFEFSGGVEFPFPDGSVVRSANITPDKETGIGTWNKEIFIKRFRDSMLLAEQAVKPGDYNTVMPWTTYAGMNDTDLGAIYDYLTTLPAVNNKVEKFTPASSK
jgi:mono/diheme cytochrome c family protein